MGIRKVNNRAVRITVISAGLVACPLLLLLAEADTDKIVDEPCPLSVKNCHTHTKANDIQSLGAQISSEIEIPGLSIIFTHFSSIKHFLSEPKAKGFLAPKIVEDLATRNCLTVSSSFLL